MAELQGVELKLQLTHTPKGPHVCSLVFFFPPQSFTKSPSVPVKGNWMATASRGLLYNPVPQEFREEPHMGAMVTGGTYFVAFLSTGSDRVFSFSAV